MLFSYSGISKKAKTYVYSALVKMDTLELYHFLASNVSVMKPVGEQKCPPQYISVLDSRLFMYSVQQNPSMLDDPVLHDPSPAISRMCT